MSKFKLIDALAKGSVKRTKPMSKPGKAPKGGVTVPLNSIKTALGGKGKIKKKKKKKPGQ